MCLCVFVFAFLICAAVAVAWVCRCNDCEFSANKHISLHIMHVYLLNCYPGMSMRILRPSIANCTHVYMRTHTHTCALAHSISHTTHAAACSVIQLLCSLVHFVYCSDIIPPCLCVIVKIIATTGAVYRRTTPCLRCGRMRWGNGRWLNTIAHGCIARVTLPVQKR